MPKVLIAALIGVFIWFLQLVGGEVEGRFSPVVAPAYIERVEPVGRVSTRIWGWAAKLRTCSFNRLEWRLGDGRSYALVDLEFEEGSKVRGDGRFHFGPWRLHLTPEQLFERSYAVVYHRCHWLWLTRTRFYR